MNLYCITHKKIDYIEKLNLIPSGVGNYNYPHNYENEKKGENISEKNSSYGELTFHYWFWKNKIDKLKKMSGLVFVITEDSLLKTIFQI